jgi:MFS family permease
MVPTTVGRVNAGQALREDDRMPDRFNPCPVDRRFPSGRAAGRTGRRRVLRAAIGFTLIAAIGSTTSPAGALTAAGERVTRTTDQRTVVAAGRTQLEKGRSVSWRVERTPGAYGTTCWRFVAKPPAKTPRYNGPDNAKCLARPAQDAAVEEVPQVVAWSAQTLPYGLLVVVVPRSVTKARVGFAGGRVTNAAAAGPGVFVTVSKEVPLIERFSIRGRRVTCAGGSMIEFADLKDPILTRASVGMPFICDVP